MECLYLPDVDTTTLSTSPEESERKHIRALRLKQNEEVMITNGKGICFFARINFENLHNPVLIIDKYIENYGEHSADIDILICNLSDKNRLEWIVEKSTELGVSKILIKNCKYSQNIKVDLTRLTNKAIAAIKQCKRACLPDIQIIDSNEFLSKDLLNLYKSIILLDENGINPMQLPITSPILIIVGPEGGLHPAEIAFLEGIQSLIKWRLGNRRLRAETAIISALSIAVNKL